MENSKNSFKVEYVWLDGNTTPQIRSKTKIIESSLYELTLENIPSWSFDGSSTKQAEGNDSDCVLKPVKLIRDPLRSGVAYVVLCEVYNKDGITPHPSNDRAELVKLEKDYNHHEFLFGFEQEYTLINLENGRPIGFPDVDKHFPSPQGDYYCGVGTSHVKGRPVVEDHLDACLDAGLKVSGINAEVMLGQWEYQIGPLNAVEVSDQIILSRYFLERVSEMYNIGVSLHPKPVEGPWNGSGCHINISTKGMREDKFGGASPEYGMQLITRVCYAFEKKHDDFIKVYGEDNHLRLTGEFETSPIDEFSWGISDRGRSIRIPVSTQNNGFGYFEDRRPASNVDPYKATNIIIKTIGELLDNKSQTKTNEEG